MIMVKQHLEGILSKTLKYVQTSYPEYKIWYMKIQNNPLAHKQTPADFIVLSKDNNTLIECKETKTDRFTFNRITQEVELDIFSKIQDRNKSFLLICFWDKRLKSSDIYLIDIKEFKKFKIAFNKQSITRAEAQKLWAMFKVNIYTKANILVIRNIYDNSPYYIKCSYDSRYFSNI